MKVLRAAGSGVERGSCAIRSRCLESPSAFSSRKSEIVLKKKMGRENELIVDAVHHGVSLLRFFVVKKIYHKILSRLAVAVRSGDGTCRRPPRA